MPRGMNCRAYVRNLKSYRAKFGSKCPGTGRSFGLRFKQRGTDKMQWSRHWQPGGRWRRCRGSVMRMANSQRRSLSIGTLDDYRQEIVQLDHARHERDLNRTGNWSLDQCCQHLGRWIKFSIDGFPFKYPWHHRLIGRLVRLVSWRLLVSIASRRVALERSDCRSKVMDHPVLECRLVEGHESLEGFGG
jgi:hypothetical protein